MSLPALDPALPTIQSLHKLAMLLGFVRILAYEAQSNYLELAMKIVPQGLSTDTLPGGGEVILDFGQGAILYTNRAGHTTPFATQGKSQGAIFEALLTAIETSELSQTLARTAGETVIDRAINAAHALPRYVRRNINEFIETEPLTFDAQHGADYAKALYSLFTATARFRARLIGSMTPIVVWPEHFDLSTLWFHPDNPEMDASKAHLNFGFAPYSPGLGPYLYAYAYPYPAQYTAPTLPAGAHWHTEGWTGVVLPYEVIASQNQPELYVEQALHEINAGLRPLIGLS